MKETEGKTHWETTVTARTDFFRLNLAEIWRYRDLLRSFVIRDFVTFYKQTILGPLWYVIQPLSSSFILYIVFARIANLQTGTIPPFLFYLSGNIIWIYFSENVVRTSETFIQNAGIFGKVYFPRLVVPLSTSISGLISFGIQLGIFVTFASWYSLNNKSPWPSLWILLLPFLILYMSLVSFAVGTILSALTIKYRDLRFVLKFGMQLWMFASPVAYPIGMVPKQYLDIYMLNPITPVIEAFRFMFFHTSTITPEQLTINFAISAVLVFTGLFLFKSVEKNVMDSV